jgi:hypothetical protein
VLLVAARLAAEHGLALAIGSFAMPTLGTCLARVARVHLDYGDTSPTCFVGHERVELMKRSTGELIARVTAPCRNPFADPLEVFQGNSPSGAFGGFNNFFRYLMILVLAVAGLFPGDSFPLLPPARNPLSTICQTSDLACLMGSLTKIMFMHRFLLDRCRCGRRPRP